MTKVLILAAGMGKRLNRHTLNKTKCMVEVNGISLIERLILQLSIYSIDEIVIVTGYKHEALVEHISSIINKYSITIPFKYIHNKDYNITNNIYSLYLAKDELYNNDIILFESDLIFDDSIIKQVFTSNKKNFALTAPYKNYMDGTVVTIENNNITAFIDKNNFDYSKQNTYYKTANIYKISKEFSQNGCVYFLEAYIKSKGLTEYYEQVLSVIISMGSKEFQAEIIQENSKWYEIDDQNDLDIAETLFNNNEPQKYFNRYGGYWRFNGLKDYCYLVNPYFPTPKMIDEFKNTFNILLTNYPSSLKIINKLAAVMFNVETEYILAGNGAAELIRHILTSSYKITGVILPSFEEYINSMPGNLVKILEVENNSFQYTALDIISFIQNNNIERMVIIAPDNPSGFLISYREITSVLEYAEENGVEIIFDESFMDFAEDNQKYTLIDMDILNKYKTLSVIKSISKSYGVPGLRLGVLISSNNNIINLVSKSSTIWNINSYAEFFLQIIGKYKQDFIKGCSMFTSERNRFVSLLKQISCINIYPSQANYILCKIENSKFDMHHFITSMLNNNFLIKDCSNKYGFHNGFYIRLAVKSEHENNMLFNALKEYFITY